MRYLVAEHFSQDTHENLQKTRNAIEKEILVCLIKLVTIHTCTEYFSFLVGHRYTWKDTERLELHYCIVEEVNFVDEEFLYKKLRNKDVYVVYGATGDIPEDGFS